MCAPWCAPQATTWSNTLKPGDQESVVITFTAPDDAPIGETVEIVITITTALDSPNYEITTSTKIVGDALVPVLFNLILPLLLLGAVFVVVALIYRRR